MVRVVCFGGSVSVYLVTSNTQIRRNGCSWMPAWIVVIWFKIPASSICDKCWHGYWWPGGKSLHVRFLVDVGVESGVSGGFLFCMCNIRWTLVWITVGPVEKPRTFNVSWMLIWIAVCLVENSRIINRWWMPMWITQDCLECLLFAFEQSLGCFVTSDTEDSLGCVGIFWFLLWIVFF